MQLLSPLDDFVFKALFAREDRDSKVILIDLLNEILKSRGENTIVNLDYLNPFNYKEYLEDKLSVLDIKAKTEKGERINIEIQVRTEKDYRKRSLYYWATTGPKRTVKQSEHQNHTPTWKRPSSSILQATPSLKKAAGCTPFIK